MMNKLVKCVLKIGLLTGIGGVSIILLSIFYISVNLPSIDNLQAGQLEVPLKIYTADGHLMAEYGENRRTPISLSKIPEKLKLAILATEDRRFYEHPGIDLRGLLRASAHMIAKGTKEQGASTITMQVARNFFLSRNKTFSRKLNEILLALKIEKELSKDEILELYLNKIYFGKKAYGVAAACEVYFGKSIEKLSLDQIALIAGLPQAPSALNPVNNPQGALKRRNHVLNRMLHYGFITQKEHQKATQTPIKINYHGPDAGLYAPYVSEMVRQEIINLYSEEAYTQGLSVYTTIHSDLQKTAQEAVQTGLREYDKRHGYRGAIGKVTLPSNLATCNSNTLLNPYVSYSKLFPAIITKTEGTQLHVLMANNQKAQIPHKGAQWALHQKSIPNVFKKGDVIYVEKTGNEWMVSQVPEASGALVALNPQNGAIKALVGGYDFRLSNFNRATQAFRQSGSNFKPFLYAAALEKGYTAASIINDAPFVVSYPNQEAWKPQNVTKRFGGPTRLRIGLTESINLVSIRLLEAIGIPQVIQFLDNFGFEKKNLPTTLSLALGTNSITPLQLATRYASFANGGYKIDSHLITRIENNHKEVIFEAQPIAVCADCEMDLFNTTQSAPRILSPQTAYIMNSLLQDAIQSGTGARAKRLNRLDVGGKTGTTQNEFDAWFSGYHPTLVATTWVGFDEPKSLKEGGSHAALPIWIKFMANALKSTPPYVMVPPSGMVSVKIDPKTGLLARPDQNNAIFEVFREGTVPSEMAPYHEAEVVTVEITPKADSNNEALF